MRGPREAYDRAKRAVTGRFIRSDTGSGTPLNGRRLMSREELDALSRAADETLKRLKRALGNGQ